jgi:putative NIF3 family GTP cyclohydrolase 1 type 2
MKTKVFFILLISISLFSYSQDSQPKTPEDVVSLIKKNITCDWAEQTVDNFKAGDPNTKLKGIAVCMFADIQTLKEAVKQNCNFIITHEPVFYNHTDETESFSDDPVFQDKMKFIKENKLVIFRFHDHIHRTEPDGISHGMINKLGLKNYAVNGSQTFFKIPEISLSDYSYKLKKELGIESIRVIGNQNMKFTKVGFAAGAPGGQSHIRLLRNPNVEVIIAGEAPEWETYLYANDAVEQGKNKAVIFLGHIKSEEAGMEYCADWLQTFISATPIHFIENKANFSEL